MIKIKDFPSLWKLWKTKTNMLKYNGQRWQQRSRNIQTIENKATTVNVHDVGERCMRVQSCTMYMYS